MIDNLDIFNLIVKYKNQIINILDNNLLNEIQVSKIQILKDVIEDLDLVIRSEHKNKYIDEKGSEKNEC